MSPSVLVLVFLCKDMLFGSMLLIYLIMFEQDSFVVRMFDPRCSPMEVVSEIPLKLTRKCLDAFGQDVSDPNGDSQRRTVCKCEGLQNAWSSCIVMHFGRCKNKM